MNKRCVVKSRLKHILGISKTTIFARKCILKEINPKDKNDFLNEIHIQGEDKSRVKVGAYYNDELVSVMTFSKRRIALGSRNVDDTDFELSRFAVKYQITGIANRLLKYFIKNNNPKTIISYSDRRWNTGVLYENLGFTKISDGAPEMKILGIMNKASIKNPTATNTAPRYKPSKTPYFFIFFEEKYQ